MQENKMGYVPMPKLMLTMGLPMIASMLVQAFYNIVDTYFISHITSSTIADIGDLAMNALTLAYPVQMLMIAIGVGTGVGVNALLSKYLGEKKREKASLIAGNAILIGICTFLVFFLFGLFGVEAFFRTQTSDPIVSEMACTYLRICCIFSFGSIGSMIFEKLLQSTGRTMLSTIAQLAGAITNIVLDPIMIFGYFGLPAMGVAGAAWATIIGQIVTLVMDMWFHYRRNTEIDPSLAYIKPDRSAIRDIYKIGIPAIIMQSLMSIMSYGINIIFGGVSQNAVTAFGVYYKVQQFVYFAAFGMNNAIIPIVSYNFGKQDQKRIQDGIFYGTLYTVILTVAGMILLQTAGSAIVGLFGLTGTTSSLCVLAMRIVSLGYFFAGLNIAYQGIYQALGNGVRSLIVSLIRLIIVPLPLAMALANLNDPTTMIWWCFPVAEFLGSIVAVYYMRKTREENGLTKKKGKRIYA
ncbi:MATE family efflux transporter [Catenisphaera adipataccumulans]|jgi:multidrug efflux pump|uniref:Putative MATE family efflux protein n=1 Tax=Catenisphaera adipataccumulans TaxID=700500 RepID=A0A7W8CVW2_9FIRM|nr:MATE family efflux transporter [Catenisphaera adipataccumulans]MBB5182550.1 putative MATE family efflux protein [Catenisphaera adipataccumulans]